MKNLRILLLSGVLVAFAVVDLLALGASLEHGLEGASVYYLARLGGGALGAANLLWLTFSMGLAMGKKQAEVKGEQTLDAL